MTSFDLKNVALPASTYEPVALEDLHFAEVRAGLEYWQSLRGARAFPARSQIEPRAIARLLTNVILLKVIGDGDDFEFLIVGDEVVRAYRSPLIHRRISDVAKDLPNSATYWGGVYRSIYRERKPWAVRYSAGLDGEARFRDAEAVLLPLGPNDDVVDHILTIGKRTVSGG